MITKPSSLETFLANTLPSASGDERQAGQGSIDTAGRMVVLTNLAQSDSPISLDEMANSSELGIERCSRVLELLEKDDLVQKDQSGYVLTEPGRKAAEQERSRLLSP
jgi:hypothetical protein